MTTMTRSAIALLLATGCGAMPAFAQEAEVDAPRRTRIGLGPQLVPR